nr:LysM peptidoglycan-binding domain-containing protein [Streptomyces sp. SID3343]
MAAVLLGGLALTASVGSAGAASATAATSTVSAPALVGDAQQSAAISAAVVHAGPTHTVGPGDTLWSIAETRLGDGTRWHDIADLNLGQRMPGGAVFDADRTIHVGWQLRLPADAQTALPDAAEDTKMPGAPVVSAARDLTATHTVTVKPGDTLSAIAERELGDGDRYPEIVKANQGVTQPDGTALTDPDEIHPGWTLTLPSPPEPEDSEAEPTADTPAPTQDPTATHDTTPAQDPKPAQPPHEAPAGTTGTTSPPASPATPAGPSKQSGGDHGPSILLPAVLGLGSLTGAALLANIAVRRRHQQRVRRTHQRIALPAAPVADYEQRLRAGETPELADFVDRALRTLADRLSDLGRPMPGFTTLRVDRAGVELVLQQPEPAVTPFVNVDVEGARWSCPLDAPLLSAEAARALPAPCPALAPIAVGPTSEVLLDLESSRVTTLAEGTEQDHREILRALAVGLLTSHWGEDKSITLVGLRGMTDFEPQHNPQLAEATLPDAIRALTTWQRDSAPALTRESLDSARAGRTLLAAPDTWPPSIVLSLEPLDADAVAALVRLEAQQPHAAWAVVAPAGEDHELPAHWHRVPAGEGPVVMKGFDEEVTVHRMPDATHSALLEMVGVADVPNAVATRGHATAATSLGAGPATTTEPADKSARVGQPPSGATDSEPLTDRLHIPFSAVEPEQFEPEQADDHRDERALATVDPGPRGLVTAQADQVARPELDESGDETKTPAQAVRGVPTPTLEFEPESSRAPEIMVLGPVEIAGVGKPAEASKRARLTELAAYMVLRPGTGHADVDAAMWPDSTSSANRYTAVSKLRRWLGTDPDGEPYLPMIGDGGYRLAAGVTCDWHRFQLLAHRGMRLGPEGVPALTEALTLVRGAPFGALSPRRYIWAEYLRQEMISAIVDVAAVLGELHLTDGDVRAAKVALGKGLAVSPESEMLYRPMFRAAHISGGPVELDAYVARLNDVLDAMGCDMEEDTIEVIRQLQSR